MPSFIYFYLLLVLFATAPASVIAENIFPLPPEALPASCHPAEGVFAYGSKTMAIYRYREYAAVLPAPARKSLQSLNCAGEDGTLFYFEYKKKEDKEQALLFIRPVLAKQREVPEPLAIREEEKSFILVSFRHPPPELLNGGSPSAPPPPDPLVPVPARPAGKPGEPGATPQQMNDLTSGSLTLGSPPAAPMEPGNPTVRIKPAAPPPREIKYKKPRPVSEPAPPPPPATPALPSLPKSPDLSIQVIDYFASKLGCEGNPPKQTQNVCTILKEFATGFALELPLKDRRLYLGATYTIDSYGRLTGLHYHVLAGTERPAEASFFSITSSGGTDDFEIQQLMEANQNKKPLPENDLLKKIYATAPRKRFALGATDVRSSLLLPGGPRRCYLRLLGDHLILVAPSGSVVDEQIRSTLVVGLLY